MPILNYTTEVPADRTLFEVVAADPRFLLTAGDEPA